MREILYFVFLKTLLAESFIQHLSGCGGYAVRERCNEISCSGSMESTDTFEKNDQRLTWKSCNESIRNQMKDMFPGLKFEHDDPKKCSPVCATYVLSKCDPKTAMKHITGPSFGPSLDKCKTKLTSATIYEWVQKQLGQLGITTHTTHIATETVTTTVPTTVTTKKTTTVTTKVITTTTTKITRSMAEKAKDYQGKK